MKHVTALFLLCILNSYLFSVGSPVQMEKVVRRVMYYSPELKFEGSVEKTAHAYLDGILKAMNSFNEIEYVLQDECNNHIDLFDVNDPYSIGDFFLRTQISGTVDLQIAKEMEQYKISIITTDFISSETSYYYFFITENDYFEKFKNNYQKIRIFLKNEFQPLDTITSFSKKMPNRLLLRQNLPYLFNFSFLNSIVFTDMTGIPPYYPAIGLGVSCNFFFKVHKIYINNSFHSGFAVSNNIESNELYQGRLSRKNNTPLYITPDIRFDITLGVLMPNEIAGIGLGAGSVYSTIFRDISRGDLFYFERVHYFLGIVYMNVLLKPDKDLMVSFDIGSHFSLTHFREITPSMYFPLFFKPAVRYMVSERLYLEFALAFMMKSYRFIESSIAYSPKPSASIILQTGIGSHREWSNK